MRMLKDNTLEICNKCNWGEFMIIKELVEKDYSELLVSCILEEGDNGEVLYNANAHNCSGKRMSAEKQLMLKHYCQGSLAVMRRVEETP